MENSIITSREKYVATLVPKKGIPSDGEDSEDEIPTLMDVNDFEERLIKNFEGVEEFLYGDDDVSSINEEDDQLEGEVEQESEGWYDVEIGKSMEEDECEFLDSETTQETGIGEPEAVISMVHRRNLDVPQVSSINYSVCSDESPFETSLSTNKPTTRSEKKQKIQRFLAATPPNVPLNSKAAGNNTETEESQLPSTSKQDPVGRALSFTEAKAMAQKQKQPAIKKTKKGYGFRWKKRRFMKEVTLPEKKAQLSSTNPKHGPFPYFQKFFTDELIDYIVEQSQLYSFQQTAKCVDLNRDSLCDFLAIHIYMGLCRMRSFRDYWSDRLGWEIVMNIMSLDRYAEIRGFLHFANNDTDEQEDRFFKIRPLFEYLRKKFLECDGLEKKYIIDGMIVKYKGKKAGIRRHHMPKNPIKWVFDFFVREGVSGFVYDMLIYSGQDTLDGFSFPFPDNDLTFSGKVAAALCQSIPDAPLSAILIDDWFNSPQLMYLLRKHYGILSLGTLRSDRTAGAIEKLSSDKEMAEKGRGTFEIVSDNVKQLCIVKWFDTESVLLGSSFKGDEPVGVVRQYSKEENKKIPVDCPALINEFDKFTGSVYKSDMLISSFKTPLKSFKWYMNIFSWLLDISLRNAWILYREDNPDKKISLKKFKLRVAKGLLLKGKPRNKKTSKNKIRERAPSEEVRYDQIDHFPVSVLKGKCSNCRVRQTEWACTKCNTVRLCLTEKRNCFFDYHSIPEL